MDKPMPDDLSWDLYRYLLSDIEKWTFAAYSYLVIDQLGSPLPPEELNNFLSEAVYHAGGEEFSVETLSTPELNLDPALLTLLKAHDIPPKRITKDEADRGVNQVMKERPDLMEASLIKYEILYAQGRFDEATDLLLEMDQIEKLLTCS